MSERYFVPEEVERLIPQLTELMGRIRDAHAEASEARERLHAEQQRITMSGGGVVDARAWAADRERMQRAGREIEAGAQSIAALGGVIKDLGLGLVDFPHRRGGRVVNLCWKHGEQAIRFWHGLDEGYASRKPL